MRGAYMWSNINVKERVGLPAGRPIRGGALKAEKYGI